jgi:cytochrome c5
MLPIWNLKKYDREGTTMNWAGDSHDSYSVIIDSALGVIGAAPKNKNEFREEVKWLQQYLREKAPPKFPFPIDGALAASGKTVFDANCAGCHASDKTGKRMPLDAVGTDPERIWTWSKDNAIAANKVVKGFGIERKGLVEEPLVGYNAPFLDGLWLRAPYLHNGSVPTVRDLLTSPEQRPKVFWRGYNLYDPVNLGFVSQSEEAKTVGMQFDTTARAAGNQGHAFGVTLPAGDKDALIEYLKTF